jgi:hypothetical protein
MRQQSLHVKGRDPAFNDFLEQLAIHLPLILLMAVIILFLAILDDVICKGRIPRKWMSPVDDDGPAFNLLNFQIRRTVRRFCYQCSRKSKRLQQRECESIESEYVFNFTG